MAMPKHTPEELETIIPSLTEMGYMELRVINGKLCGTMDYFTTRGIVIGLDYFGVERRYCYQNRQEASEAFATYNDHDQHPSGNWIKLKGTYRGQPVDDLNPNWSRS